MKHLAFLIVLCYATTLVSSRNPYYSFYKQYNIPPGGQPQVVPYQQGGQQPNYYGGGQQPNNYYGGGQQPNNYYGGGQQPNNNYGEVPAPRIACDPPMCAPGCSLQKVYDGPCPGCDCSGQQPNNYYGGGQQPNYNYGGVPAPQIECDPPMCGPGCSLQKVYSGPCPGCDCSNGGQQPNNYYGGGQQQNYNYGGVPAPQIACDPPMCGPGCSLQKVYSGPCPGCDCSNAGQQPVNYQQGCAPPNCPSFCSIGTRPDGCPECICYQN